MVHPLDRPVWNALHSRQAHLAIGGGAAVGFERSCEVFVAAADPSADSLAAVAALVPQGGQASYVEAESWPLPPGTKLVRQARLLQMVAPEGIGEPDPEFGFLELSDPDAPEMLALATLCRPGPYFARTHALGGFIGVRDERGRLIAMAGERFKIGSFSEVSAVCTRPDARGGGLARNLMRVVAGRIAARGETCFLHTFPDNAGAIGLYEALGFRQRAEINYTIFERD
jgi:predicted GNAT family acetyltransferase